MSFPKAIHNPSSFDNFAIVYVDCTSFSPFIYVIVYKSQHKLFSILSDEDNFKPILSEIFSLISLL